MCKYTACGRTRIGAAQAHRCRGCSWSTETARASGRRARRPPRLPLRSCAPRASAPVQHLHRKGCQRIQHENAKLKLAGERSRFGAGNGANPMLHIRAAQPRRSRSAAQPRRISHYNRGSQWKAKTDRARQPCSHSNGRRRSPTYGCESTRSKKPADTVGREPTAELLSALTLSHSSLATHSATQRGRQALCASDSQSVVYNISCTRMQVRTHAS